MNLLSIVSIIVFLIYLELGLYVFFKNKSSKLNRSFFALCLGLAVWAFSFVFIHSSENSDTIVFWYKASAIGWCLTPSLMIRFKFYLTNIPEKNRLKNILFGAFLLPGIYFIYIIFTDKWILIDVEKYESFRLLVYDNSYIFYYLYLIYLYILLAFAVLLLFLWRRNIKERKEKLKFGIILISFLISLLYFIIIDFTLPLINEKLFLHSTHIAAIVYIGGLAFSMLKFRLFTVTPSIVANKVINELEEILFFTDIKTRILKTNDYTSKILGYKISKIYGTKLETLFAEENLPGRYIKKALSNDVAVSIETKIKSSTETLIPVKLYLLVVKDEFDDILGYVVHGYDNRESIELAKEIEIKKQTELKLKNVGGILERLVRERTKELEKSYKKLQIEIADSMRIEEKIKADISEKEVLINEIHNRVISNMHMIISLIYTQASQSLSENVNSRFQELNQRITSMLLVHDNLYLSINYSDVDFARFLNAITANLSKLYNKDNNIAVKSNIYDVFLNIDYAIPLGLIANELITNAFLHAFPSQYKGEDRISKPSVFINYSFDGEYYYLIVSDNGIGLPDQFNIEDLQTTGVPLVDILVNEQINGEWSISSDEFTYVKVVFRSEK